MIHTNLQFKNWRLKVTDLHGHLPGGRRRLRGGSWAQPGWRRCCSRMTCSWSTNKGWAGLENSILKQINTERCSTERAVKHPATVHSCRLPKNCSQTYDDWPVFQTKDLVLKFYFQYILVIFCHKSGDLIILVNMVWNTIKQVCRFIANISSKNKMWKSGKAQIHLNKPNHKFHIWKKLGRCGKCKQNTTISKSFNILYSIYPNRIEL